MDESAEARLVDAARRGSFEAYSELVRRWYGQVFDFCLAVTGDRTVAAGLARTAFERGSAFARSAAPATAAVIALRPAWVALADAGWFAMNPDDALVSGPDAAFPEVSRQLAAVLHLLHRTGVDSAGLARIMDISPAAAEIVANRADGVAATRLGPPEAARLASYATAAPARFEPGELDHVRERLAASWPEEPATLLRDTRPPPPSPPAPRVATALGLPLAAAAALLAALLLVPESPIALTRPAEPPAIAPVFPSPTPSPTGASGWSSPAAGSATTAPPGSPSRATPTPLPASPSPGEQSATAAPSPTAAPELRTATPTRTPTAGPTPTRTATPTPSPSPSATATPTQTPVCTPQIGVVANRISLPPNGQSTIQVFNRDACSEATFVVGVGAAWLGVAPASGAIPPFPQSVILQLSAVPPPEGETETTVTITGPANSVTVLVEYIP